MKLKDIYEFFIREGVREDLRPQKQVQSHLKEAQKKYLAAKGFQKKFFDRDRLWNPYGDTRILNGSANVDVHRILVGVDVELGEVLLADRLAERGEGVDLVLTHHPEGAALAGLEDVMALQTDVLCNLGIDQKIARDLMQKRIEEVGRRLHGSNHMRTVDAARVLKIPLMACHTPADNHVARYLQTRVDQEKPKTLSNIVDILLEEPEYQDAVRVGAGPRIFLGKPEDKAGRIFVDMTGGTSGSSDVFARLSQIGITTQIGMHLSESHYKKIKSEYMNVVIAGHIASDNLGLNLILDKLERRGKFDFLECSGFRRYRRK